MKNKKYSYDDLVKDLAIGREFEFEYGNHKYSFSHSKQEWYLMRYGDEDSITFQSYQELLAKGKIEEKTIKDVWDDIRELEIY